MLLQLVFIMTLKSFSFEDKHGLSFTNQIYDWPSSSGQTAKGNSTWVKIQTALSKEKKKIELNQTFVIKHKEKQLFNYLNWENEVTRITEQKNLGYVIINL